MSKWKETSLNKIGNVVSGGTPSTSISEFWDGDILFVTPNDLSKSVTPFIEDTQRKISIYGLANSSANILPIGSVVISSRAPIGYVAVGKKEFTTNQGCKSIIPNHNFDSLYLYYCFIFYVERIKKLGAGSTFAEISKGDLESVKFPHPESLPEQRKIAQILSTTDSVIEKTQAAIAKYKAIKQGMLHDLFTRGIDVTTGKLRPKQQDAPELYKESSLGWIPKEWDVKRLEDSEIEILDGDRGVNYPKENDFSDSGFCLFLSATNVSKNGFKFGTKQFISKEKDELLGTGKLKREDVIVTTRGTVGNVVYYGNDIPYNDIRINSGMIILRNGGKKIKNDFFFHYVKDYLFEIIFQKSLSGSAQPQLPIKDLKKFFIIYTDENEQMLISHILNSLNKKITTEQTYLQKLQMLKAGLMNDLLSGKKEVKLTDHN